MSLLRRIGASLSVQGPPQEPRTSSSLPRGVSFCDFSCGADAWHADEHTSPEAAHPGAGVPLASVNVSSPESRHPTPFGSEPAGAGFLAKSASPALRIPRTTVAHLLEQRLKAADSGTPRSSLDMHAANSLPSPHAVPLAMSPASMPASPRSPGAADASEPASPRSPRTPGGRRRKTGKIDGMDYYEFCELIRSSSL